MIVVALRDTNAKENIGESSCLNESRDFLNKGCFESTGVNRNNDLSLKIEMHYK